MSQPGWGPISQEGRGGCGRSRDGNGRVAGSRPRALTRGRSLPHSQRKQARELLAALQKVVVPIYCTSFLAVEEDKQQKIARVRRAAGRDGAGPRPREDNTTSDGAGRGRARPSAPDEPLPSPHPAPAALGEERLLRRLHHPAVTEPGSGARPVPGGLCSLRLGGWVVPSGSQGCPGVVVSSGRQGLRSSTGAHPLHHSQCAPPEGARQGVSWPASRLPGAGPALRDVFSSSALVLQA